MKIEERITNATADFVIKYHIIILLVAVVLIVLSLIAAKNIRVKTELKDMMPMDNPIIKSFDEIEKRFAGGAFVFITIEGNDKNEMAKCAEDFVKVLENDEDAMKYVKAINLKVERDFITKWGLMFQEADDLENTRKNFSKLNLLPFITALNNSFEETYTGDDADKDLDTRKQENEAVAMLNQMESFFVQLREYIDNPDKTLLKEQGKNLAETFLYGDLYNYSPDNSMLMFSITPNFSSINIEECKKLMVEIKKISKEIQSKYPELIVGYTGDVAMQSDEQDAMGYDMLIPFLAALIIILFLLSFSFNQIRVIIFAILCLIFGIIYTIGIIGFTIKVINMMTSFLTVLLLGLGIDYGIQVITNFTTYRSDGYDPKEALRLTYNKAGVGTFLAALTTSIAFFVLATTGSMAFSQFGFVMGLGILICFLTMILILPSVLLLFGKKNISKQHLPNINYQFIPDIGIFINRHKKNAILISIIASVVMFGAIFLNQWEYDLMKLEPENMPSIIGYEKIMDKYGLNPFTAMVIADDLDEAREITDKLEKESLVVEINSIANYIPSNEEMRKRLEELRKLRSQPARYKDYDYGKSDIKKLGKEIKRLEHNIIEMGDLSVAGLGDMNKIIKKRDEIIREIRGAETGKEGKEVFQKLIDLLNKNPRMYAKKLTKLDNYFARAMNTIIDNMSKITRPITVNDLPESITKTIIEEGTGNSLITIYPKEHVFDNVKNMRRYNRKLEKISKKITGMTQITTEWMDEMIPSSQRAGIYIFIVVFIFMLISFRSLKTSLLASVPLVVGMIWMLGVYPLIGLKLNLMNFAMIPLVIGMGIDFGIHIVHRYTVEKDIAKVYKYTGKAVFLSAMTTMIGFGSLALIASFGYMVTLGAILFLGILMCLLATLLVLPAVFKKQEK